MRCFQPSKITFLRGLLLPGRHIVQSCQLHHIFSVFFAGTLAIYIMDDFDQHFECVKRKYDINFSLKPQQKEIITSILSKKPTFGILPTGFGKSMCYLLPPLLMDEVGDFFY